MAKIQSALKIPADFVQLHAAGGAPGSDVDCPPGTIGLLVGTAGTLNVVMGNGTARALLPVPAGLTYGDFAAVNTGGTAQDVWAAV